MAVVIIIAAEEEERRSKIRLKVCAGRRSGSGGGPK